MTPPSPVSHVSDTARWVAVYRAMESERPDAIFNDPFARGLAGTRGEEIVAGMVKGRQLSWPMVVRTAVMDEIVMRAVERDGIDTVLNLAVGLDTRPYRLSLAPSLRWIDADLPDILAYKEAQLASERPTCRLDYAKVDLTDATARGELLARVARDAARALVLTEGLLVYLPPNQVTDLARDLASHEAYRWWLTDLASPRLLKMLKRTWGKQLSEGNAPMRFGPAEGTAFFEPSGWNEVEYRPMFEESIRLNRTMRFGRFWYRVGKLYPKKKQEEFRRMSGIVLMQRR